ncbi:MAG: hypothetical protein WAX89_07765 [Alphaproteobacteria bacterium]
MWHNQSHPSFDCSSRHRPDLPHIPPSAAEEAAKAGATPFPSPFALRHMAKRKQGGGG